MIFRRGRVARDRPCQRVGVLDGHHAGRLGKELAHRLLREHHGNRGVLHDEGEARAGADGSTGTYTAPAFSTATSDTISSADCSRHTPMRAPGSTPRRRSRQASRLPRSFSSR